MNPGSRIGLLIGLVSISTVIGLAWMMLASQAPAAAQNDPRMKAGICERTSQVQDAILALLTDVTACGDVTGEHLAGITGVMSLQETGITALNSDDFAGLTGLGALRLSGNTLSVLPADVFNDLDTLTQLYLGGNNLSALPEGVFDELPRLQRLYLSRNALQELPEDVFEHNPHLTRFALDNNNFANLPEDLFEHQANAQSRLLSLYMGYNDLTEVPDDLFDGLVKLELLELMNNNLDALPEDLFDGLTNLEILFLQRNSLTAVPEDTFEGLSELRKLDLQINDIESLPEDLFDGLGKMETLYLGGNEFTTLHSDVFDGLSNLESLNLLHSKVSDLPDGIFDDLDSLKRLDLYASPLNSLEADEFEELPGLTHLYLGRIGLTTLPAGIFDDLSDLEALTLGSNSLSSLPQGVFDNLTNLTRLSLLGNDLTTEGLPDGVLANLGSLEELLLMDNELESLPEGLFQGVTELTFLTLNYNPGAPFTLTAELQQNADDDIVAPGAPFDINVTLSATGGTLATTTATVGAGSTTSTPIAFTKDDPVVTVYVSAASLPPISDSIRYHGIQTGLGETPTVAPQPGGTQNTPPTGAPTISGTVQIGQTLTSDTSTIADSDGISNATFTYQWMRNDGASDADIQDAISSAYTLQDEDQGKTIKVQVSFTDDAGNEETLTSEATDTVEARPNSPSTGQPTISGTAQVGETLASDTSAISDPDGLDNASFAYQWMAVDAETAGGTSDNPIKGATGATYAVQTGDAGKAIKVQVSFADDAGHQESVISDPTARIPGLWAGTITVGHGPVGSDSVGYSTFVSGMGSITTPDFRSNGVSCRVQAVAYNHEGFHLGLSKAFSTPFTLHVDAKRFESSEASTSQGSESYIHTWSQPGLNWTEGDSVLVVLVERRTPEAQNASTNSAATGVPTISGTLEAGQTLTASASGINDADGLANATFSYQWIANDGTADTNIQGATASSHTLQNEDQGKTIKVRVNFTDDAGNNESLTSVSTAEVEAPLTAELRNEPENHNGENEITFRILFSEPVTVGYQALKEDSFEISNGTITRARRVNGRDDLRQFTVRPSSNADVVIVLPSDRPCHEEGAICTSHGKRLSSRLELFVPWPVPANVPATGAPTISGTTQVGETLTADTSGITDSNGLTNATFSYQWVRNDGSADSDIRDATSSPYRIDASDLDTSLKVRVSFTDDAGNEETLTSAGTAAVEGRPNSPATGAPTIIGEAQVGQALTASTSAVSDGDGLTASTFTYQWIRSDGTTDTNISGAADATYTLVDADQGKTVKVRVNFTDDEGNEETLTSEASAEVAAATLLTASIHDEQEQHDGQNTFTFELRFTEQFPISYATLRDRAFTVTGGTVTNARRLAPPGNARWEITVTPDSNDSVTIVLPGTTDCDDQGAVCTGDGRMLSNRLEFTVSGPSG